MAIYFTSDTHFGHTNIIKYCNRPFNSSDEMDEELIKNWNNTVDKNDIVYHLGDFSFKGKDSINKYTDRLNGTINLILGNHDVYKTLADTRRFSFIRDYYRLKVDNLKIILFHYSIREWDCKGHGSIHLWGHSHGTLPILGKSCDIGVDSPHITGKPEYRPFSFEEILKFMETRNVE